MATADETLEALQYVYNEAAMNRRLAIAQAAPVGDGLYWVKLYGAEEYNGLCRLSGPEPFRQLRVLDLHGTAWVYGSDGEKDEALDIITEWGPPLEFPGENHEPSP